jgi:hypothetical protein
MTIIIVIAVILLGGMIFLLRSPAPPPPQQQMTEADMNTLRELVLRRLQERLVGWTFVETAGKPLELSATESGSERRIEMNLEQLGAAWFPLYTARRIADAEDLLESFVAGVTGQGEGTDAEADESGLHDALALRLVPNDKVPKAALTRQAGTVAAVLCLRHPGGPELVSPEDLSMLKLTEAEAFQRALENLSADVEEGLQIEPLDDSEPPQAIAVAPHDPLSTAYLLVPAVGARLRKVLGNRDFKLYADSDGLIAAIDGLEVERDKPLIAEPLAPGALAWKAVPA